MRLCIAQCAMPRAKAQKTKVLTLKEDDMNLPFYSLDSLFPSKYTVFNIYQTDI